MGHPSPAFQSLSARSSPSVCKRPKFVPLKNKTELSRLSSHLPSLSLGSHIHKALLTFRARTLAWGPHGLAAGLPSAPGTPEKPLYECHQSPCHRPHRWQVPRCLFWWPALWTRRPEPCPSVTIAWRTLMSLPRPGPTPVGAAVGGHGPGSFRARQAASVSGAGRNPAARGNPGAGCGPHPGPPPGRPPEPLSHIVETALGKKRDSCRFCVIGLDPRLLKGKTHSCPHWTALVTAGCWASKAREIADCFPASSLQGTWRVTAGGRYGSHRRWACAVNGRGCRGADHVLVILPGGSDHTSLRGKGRDRGSKNL